MTISINPHTPEQLVEIAWGLIDEALTQGTMTLQDHPEKPETLETADIVNLVKWLATTKAKKPTPVSAPEDFQLQRTSGEITPGKSDG